MFEERPVVQQQRERGRPITETGQGPACVRQGGIDAVAIHIDQAAINREQQHQPGIGQHPSQFRLDLVWANPAQLTDQIPDAGEGQPILEQPPEERHRHGRHRQHSCRKEHCGRGEAFMNCVAGKGDRNQQDRTGRGTKRQPQGAPLAGGCSAQAAHQHHQQEEAQHCKADVGRRRQKFGDG
jgi:hypothetical protein